MKLLFLFTAATVLGVGMRCRFTVRDIGFVDLSGPLYTLRYVGSDENQLGSELTALLTGWARDGNVALGTGEARDGNVALGTGEERDGNVALGTGEERDGNVALGAGEERDAKGGFWLEREGLVPLLLRESAAPPGTDEARGIQQSALHSPVRDEVLARCLGSFAILLLVEGESEAANEAAREELATARDALRGVQDQLPRPIRRPLEELALPRTERAAERVLLWSLGLAPEETRPAVCVLYGRGKLAGRVLVGKDITGQELLAQLYLVGESCECDTQRDWVNEPTIPMAWTDRQRARAATELGFDPESPMVRAEVVRILERGYFSKGAGGLPRAELGEGVEALLLGYRETVLGGEERGGLPRVVEPDGGQPTTRPGVVVYEASEGDDWGFESEPSAMGTDPKPERGDVDVAPEGGDVDARPERGDVDATPERGDVDATPERGDVDATPERGDVDARPEADPASGPYQSVFLGLIGLLALSVLAVLLVLLPRKPA